MWQTHTHLENVRNLSNLRDVPDVWDLSDFHRREGEDNVTFTQYAAVLLETQRIHRGPFGWLDNHLPLALCSRLPALVGTQWVQMSYGPQMVSSSRLYRDNPGRIVHNGDPSRKWFRRVESTSCFQSPAQSTPINLNWGNLLVRAVNSLRWKHSNDKDRDHWNQKLWNVDGNFSHSRTLSGSPWEFRRVSNNLKEYTGISQIS